MRFVAVGALCCGLISGSSGAEVVSLEPSRDASIYENLFTANGTGDLFAGYTAGGQIRRALLGFDLASIPAGSTINSVSLTMHVDMVAAFGPADSEMSVHRVTRDWVEGPTFGTGSGSGAVAGDVTWDDASFGMTPWTTPGGDFDPVGSAVQMVDGVGSYTWSSAGLASDVQSWIDAPGSNFGWILDELSGANASARRLASREDDIIENRPTLVVDFTVPAPGAAALLPLAIAATTRRRRR